MRWYKGIPQQKSEIAGKKGTLTAVYSFYRSLLEGISH
jgi:hypothetical protein